MLFQTGNFIVGCPRSARPILLRGKNGKVHFRDPLNPFMPYNCNVRGVSGDPELGPRAMQRNVSSSCSYSTVRVWSLSGCFFVCGKVVEFPTSSRDPITPDCVFCSRQTHRRLRDWRLLASLGDNWGAHQTPQTSRLCMVPSALMGAHN